MRPEQWRCAFLAVALMLGCVPAFAQSAPDIFTAPPDEAFGLGLVLAYDGGVVTTRQGDGPLRDACGDAFGCLSWPDPGLCQIHVWTGLPFDLERMAIRNLVARCGGWAPAGE